MNKCNFCYQGQSCQVDACKDSEFCFWHQEQVKTDDDLVPKLEARARTGEPMVGFQMRKASLMSINLVHIGHKDGFKLINCDFYRADLREAHLFGCDLQGSSLMKADLRLANLHCANLSGCNLLGTRLEGARLDNISWGDEIIQEQQAREATTSASKLDYWQQAEEIYRNLRKASEQAGLFENAGHFFEREMVMRRFQMPLYSPKRFFFKNS